MNEESLDKSWMLGDDSDCDTCGWSFNEASFNPHFHDDYAWEFGYRVGCYSGGSVSYFSENREEKLNEMFKYLKTYSGWPRRGETIVRKMIEECDRLREQK